MSHVYRPIHTSILENKNLTILKTIKHNGYVIEYYDSIDDAPMDNFMAFNRFVLTDSGVGADLESIDAHWSEIAGHINRKDFPAATTQIANLRQSVVFVVENQNPRLMSFAALIHSVDGKVQNDLSDQGLRLLHDKLKKVKKGFLYRLIDSVKKNFDLELEAFFPKYVNHPLVVDYYNLLLRKIKMDLQKLKGVQIDEAAYKRLTDEIISRNTPKMFSGAKGADVNFQRAFERNNAQVGIALNGRNGKKLTVKEYYSAVSVLEENNA